MVKWIEMGGRRLRVEIAEGLASVDNIPYQVEMHELVPGVLSLIWTDPEGLKRSYQCTSDGEAILVDGVRLEYAVHDPRSLQGAATAGGATGPKSLKAPMPGRIVRVLVADGQAVEAGQGCIVIEAMKMQNELKSPKAGVVRRLAARVAETVAAGAVLLIVE